MKRASCLRPAMPLALSALIVAGVAGTASAEVEPITAEPLTGRHAFSGAVSMQITQDLDGLPPQVVELDDASTLLTVRFTIQPGAVFPWHTHPGTVLISVAEGDFVFMFADDCVAREYSAGGALVDPGNTVHTAYNPSEDTETVVMATLLGAPAEGPVTIPVDEAEGAALDEQCGIDRDDIASAHSAH